MSPATASTAPATDKQHQQSGAAAVENSSASASSPQKALESDHIPQKQEQSNPSSGSDSKPTPASVPAVNAWKVPSQNTASADK
ncbi:hypothetical protein FB639_003303, partial [Coemansia asiatica]